MRTALLIFIFVTGSVPVTKATSPAFRLVSYDRSAGALLMIGLDRGDAVIGITSDPRRWERLAVVYRRPAKVPRDPAEERVYFRDTEPAQRRYYKLLTISTDWRPARTAWESKGVRNYRYRFTKACCFSATVTVRDGAVTAIENARDAEGNPIAPPPREEVKTIEELYQALEERIDQVEVTVFSADPVWSFPSRLEFDFNALTPEVDLSYWISEFEPVD